VRMFVYACALLLCTPSLNTIEVVLVMERILQRSRSAAAVNLDSAVLETEPLRPRVSDSLAADP
jgi:hypothetical protein